MRVDDVCRDLPFLEQRPSQLRMVKPQHRLFRLIEELALLPTLLQQLPGLFRNGRAEDQLADVVQNTGDKQPLHIVFPQIDRHTAGNDAAGNAVLPERGHADQLLGDAVEDLDDRAGQRQVPELLGADDRHCFGDRIDPGVIAEHRAVGELEYPGCQPLIFGNDLGDVVDGAARVVVRLVEALIEKGERIDRSGLFDKPFDGDGCRISEGHGGFCRLPRGGGVRE